MEPGSGDMITRAISRASSLARTVTPIYEAMISSNKAVNEHGCYIDATFSTFFQRSKFSSEDGAT